MYTIPEACAKIVYSIVSAKRVTRCLQHLQNASHVRHPNDRTLGMTVQWIEDVDPRVPVKVPLGYVHALGADGGHGDG